MNGDKIILNDNIKTLLNRQIHPMVNLTHSLEQQSDILKNLNIEVEIADSIFTRKIQSFNLIDNSITADVPFPFISSTNNNTVTELSCTITVTPSATDHIICNGRFLTNNTLLCQ